MCELRGIAKGVHARRCGLHVGVALFVVACRAAIPAMPSQGGPAWTELTSEHFTLWTDSSPARGRELIEQCEHLHQIVFGVAFPWLPGSGKSLVIALRDRYEVGAFVPDLFIAYAMPANPALEPVIVIDAQTDNSDGHVIAHELTHVISYGAIHDQPVSFAEGIAQFFETTNLDAKMLNVDVGEPLPKLVRDSRAMTLLPGDQLFACTQTKQPDCRDPRFYMTSALLFAYLIERAPETARRARDRARRGRSERVVDRVARSAAGDARRRAARLDGPRPASGMALSRRAAAHDGRAAHARRR